MSWLFHEGHCKGLQGCLVVRWLCNSKWLVQNWKDTIQVTITGVWLGHPGCQVTVKVVQNWKDTIKDSCMSETKTYRLLDVCLCDFRGHPCSVMTVTCWLLDVCFCDFRRGHPCSVITVGLLSHDTLVSETQTHGLVDVCHLITKHKTLVTASGHANIWNRDMCIEQYIYIHILPTLFIVPTLFQRYTWFGDIVPVQIYTTLWMLVIALKSRRHKHLKLSYQKYTYVMTQHLGKQTHVVYS
jgi:hypothetical protein